ncbi:IS607 family transposase [Limnospira sp. PMC 1223.20]|uniref:IS607 family transposase n=2 Tax=unclassified Limnospira TaxID=2642885 RepID=UPI0028E15C32|nr:IS607 family transposase [Limnospira sp. PMC 1223.20]MDT9265303.1 IS607 family transposase [Limnospira sp. PMC 1223.20]
MARYVKPKEAAQILRVHERTLRRWDENGSIETIRTPAGQRRYNVESYTAKSGSDKRKVVIYARVSSRAQQSDLNRQVAALSNLYPEAEVVSEIRGGLNFKGKKMLALLGHQLSGDVRMVVVAHKDRLAIWGFDLFRWLCEQNRCSLMVLNQTSLSPEPEMVEDILAILHCFSSRLYRRSKYKTQVKEDPDLPQPRAKSSLA